MERWRLILVVHGRLKGTGGNRAEQFRCQEEDFGVLMSINNIIYLSSADTLRLKSDY